MFKRVAFTMYPVSDVKRARDFYEDALGLPASGDGPDSPWVEFDLPGGGCLGITNLSQGVPGAPGATIAFEVEDLPALLETLRARGVTIAAEGIESPVCRMAIIRDPDGNAIILHKLKREQ